MNEHCTRCGKFICADSMRLYGNRCRNTAACKRRTLAKASPDLLEKLEMLVNVINHPNVTRAGIKMIASEARVAIAKARSE